MPTIKDVADKSGVSVITVSRYFNDCEKVSKKTQEKISNTINEIGYFPNEIARSLVKKKTNVLGIVLADTKNTYFNELFRTAENYARKLNYNVFLCNTEENCERELKYVKLLASQKVDGVILAPASIHSVKFLDKNKIKYVLVDRYYNEIKSDYFLADHYQGSKEIVEYLINKGHIKIAVLKGSGEFISGSYRYDAFIDVMKKRKIKINPDYVLDCHFKKEIAYKKTKELLSSKNKPTVIYSFNSLMTIGAIKAIKELKLKIPEDISLIAFDDLPNHEIINPLITCTIQPVEKIATQAIEHLIKKINSDKKIRTKKFIIKPEMFIGNSVNYLII